MWAAQQVAETDQAIEIRFGCCVAFGAFWFAVGFTAKPAWRLSSQPLDRSTVAIATNEQKERRNAYKLKF